MDKLQWIKDLVIAEQQMEDSGLVDMSAGFDPQTELLEATVEYLLELKTSFVEAASAFNQVKGSAIGNLKIYGISKTEADFMLFRNGHKLIFSMKNPGLITISMNSMTAHYLPGVDARPTGESQVDMLKSRWGAFGELSWTYNEQTVRIDSLVRFYMSRFVRDSAK